MPTSSTPVKTAGSVLLAHTQLASAAMVIGSSIDVSAKCFANIFVAMGRTAAAALTNDLNFIIEASAKASGNDEWYPVLNWSSQFGKSAASSTTVNDAAFNAGDATFVVTSAAGLAAGDNLYIRETGTPGNSEWATIYSLSGTTITLKEAITRNHTNGVNVVDLAEKFRFSLNLLAVSRIRLVVDAASNVSGQTTDVIGWLTTFDSVLTA